jgi:phosphoribosyl-ATP pyrophosphohydrolase/phosphoribosyl-AMP cyclohydrolase
MKIDFEKGDGLVPVIIQDVNTMDVLMLGYMNEEAYEKTLESKLVTFFSRSKQRLWTKGEESGNTLILNSLEVDCDNDTLLVKATPNGPTCHKGTTTCWGDTASNQFGVIEELEKVISSRKINPDDTSYVSSLFEKGINTIAQKVGEEAIEVVIEAKDDNEELFLNESADLFFHYLILLQAKGYSINDVLKILKERRK